MPSWVKQLAGTVLVLVFALAVGGFIMVLRAQQGGLASSMAAAHLRAVSPPDGATNVPVTGDIHAEYVGRPSQDPSIKIEPPLGVTLEPGHWDGSTFTVHYSGLRENSLYHVELDQDDWTGKGEHKQIKVRWSFRTGASRLATPTASPTVAISATPSPTPPTGAQLIWYHGPDTLLYGVDWTGKQVKSLSSDNRVQSPDGLRLWSKAAGGGTITDAGGNPVGSVAVDQQMMWADDSQSFCGITLTASSYSLETLSLDGSRHVVGPIALPTAPGQAPQSPALAACSAEADRAIVVGQSSGYTWNMSVMSLTDGHVISARRYPNPLARLIASHDGHYVAEQLAGNTGPITMIRDLSNDTVAGQVADIVVQAFSWDGSLVAGGTGAANASNPQALAMRWRTHQLLWHQCTCPSLTGVSVLPQPGGTQLAIIASWNQSRNVSFTIVDADGTSRSVPIANTPITPAF